MNEFAQVLLLQSLEVPLLNDTNLTLETLQQQYGETAYPNSKNTEEITPSKCANAVNFNRKRVSLQTGDHNEMF